MLRSQLALASTLVCLAAGVFCSSSARAVESASAAEARLRERAQYLASDALEGRGVGTDGLDKAAEFIAQQFSRIGLKTDLFEGTPYQAFSVPLPSQRGPAEKNRLQFVGSATNTNAPGQVLELDKSFTPLAAGGSGMFEANIVFAGYGITAKNLKHGDATLDYDDYAGVDAKGKVVIIIRKTPLQNDKDGPFSGSQMVPHAYFARKLSNAVEHGAAAVVFVNDGPEATKKDGDGDKLLPIGGAGETSSQDLPVLFCTRAAIDELLKASSGKNLATLESQIDRTLKPQSFELKGWRATGQTEIVARKADVKNVVGVLPGEGPLADETIVVGAHYDHLGFGGSGSLAPWTTDIHNGADDNASGTATLIDVAERLASQQPRLRRRIVFIAFTGEEKGLLGSAHYTRQPRFPLENTIAMLNLDMVGRLDGDKLAIYGTGTAQEFDPLVERLAKDHRFTLTKHAGGYGPSDHSSFYTKKIPVLHFFTGTHTDYHRPSDDAEKLNISGMRRVAEFVTDTALAIDASSSRPAYVEIRKVESLAGPGDGERPSFGSMPAYPNPVKDGVLLEAVMEGSPAEKAGIKGGDVLVKFGDLKVTILEDFEAALRQHKPGDRVKVTVRRGDQQIEADVTLARRRMQ